jgi:hypothetical protein
MQIVNELLSIYGTRRFIVVLTVPRHRTQFKPSHSIPLISIFSYFLISTELFISPFKFLAQVLYTFITSIILDSAVDIATATGWTTEGSEFES